MVETAFSPARSDITGLFIFLLQSLLSVPLHNQPNNKHHIRKTRVISMSSNLDETPSGPTVTPV